MSRQHTKARFAFGHMLAVTAVCFGGVFAAGCSGGSSGGGVAAVTAPATSNTTPGSQQSLTITPSQPLTVENDLGAGFQILVDGQFKDNNGADYEVDLSREVEYVVENTNVAQISGDGLITPIGSGTTAIKAIYNGPSGRFEAETSVTVVGASAAQPTFRSLNVYPAARTLPRVNPSTQSEQLQQVIIIATDDTGRLHDLTRSVGVSLQKSASDAGTTTLASVSPNGLVRAVDNGQVVAVGRVSSAGLVAGGHLVLGNGVAAPIDPNSLYSGAPLAGSTNGIDQAVLANLFKQFIEPAKLSSDGEFLRRLYADALGRVPTEAEATTFLASTAADKRTAEVDKVLADPGFAARWGSLMGEWFTMGRGADGTAFDTWATTQITNGETLGQMVSDMSAGNVASFDNRHDDAQKKVDILLEAGTGMSAKCGYCHDHPLVGPNDSIKWLQDDRYPLDAFFATNNTEATKRDKAGNRFGNPLQPGFVLDPTQTVTSTLQTALATRRAEFGTLFTASSAFKRGMAHRIFSEVAAPLLNPNQFLQKELDGVAVPNVLNALTAAFDASNTSLKDYLKTIFTSKFYQLSTDATNMDTQYDPLLQRFPLTRHKSEVMESAVAELTGQSITGGDLTFYRGVFGFPVTRDAITERVNMVNMSQNLVLMNSPIVQDKVTSSTKVQQLATDVGAGTITQTEAIHSLFKSAFSREATTDEITCANDAIGQAANLQEGLEDVAAALAGTIEFTLK